MRLRDILLSMRQDYDRKRRRDIRFARPSWLHPMNPIAAVYKEKRTLLQKGQVYFACIVQANSALFEPSFFGDHPAQIVYSTDPMAQEFPMILKETAQILYRYKGESPEEIPEQLREIAHVLTDEHDSSSFFFTVTIEGQPVKMYLTPTMIFRKLLPKRRLYSGLLPILVEESCKSVVVLPKRYWGKIYTDNWLAGML